MRLTHKMHSLATPLCVTIAVTVIAAGCATSPRAVPSDAAEYRAEIAGMMLQSAAAWNRGDLDGFMDDYVPANEATYVGGRGLLRGRVAIRNVYAARFAPGATRDSLSFDLQDVNPLADDLAHVIAFYILSRGDSVVARGPTSLVMRREGGRWRIVHDHSS